MDVLLDIIQSFPTALWSIPLGVSMFFWLLTMLGALDIEMLDVDVDASPDVEADIDISGDVQHGGLLHGISDALAIGTVPTTIVISSISTFGWISSVLGELTIAAISREFIGPILYGLLAMVVTFLFAVWLTTLVVKPLKRIFITHIEHGQIHLIGQVATITSSKVTDNFGIAAIAGKDLILNVICENENTLSKGDEVSIVAYDEEKNHYTVAALNAVPVVSTPNITHASSSANMPGNLPDSRTPADLAAYDEASEKPQQTSEQE